MRNYAASITRDWWKHLRWQVIGDRAKGICERCHRETATQVHHLHYPVGRREMARDLMAVCDTCHYRLHHPVAANDNFEDQEEMEV